MELFGTNIFGFRRREVQPTPPSGVPGVPSSTVEQDAPKTGSYQEHIVYARSPQVALTVSAVYRAIELRAKTIGQMVLQYQVKDSVGGNFTPSMYGKGRDLNYLLQVAPNPIMSAASLWEQVTIERLQHGNGFVYIERYGDEVEALWLAQCGGYNPELGTYNIVYLSDHGLIAKANVPREDVLHFPNTYRYQNGFWGIPTLQYAVETLSLIKTQKSQALETAAKGGRVKMLIQEKDSVPTGTRGRANQGELKRITKEFERDWANGDAIFLNNVADAKPISLTSQDMQMIDQLGIELDDVARFYATPRPLLMLDTNSHYNDYSNATMEYLQRTIAPDAREIEDECNRKFLNVYDFGKRRFHLCELPLLRMDLERQAKVDQLHLQMGWTVNEIRNQYDMPAIEKGDIPYVSTNLAELGSAKLSGESSTELKPGNYNVPNPPAKDGEGEK